MGYFPWDFFQPVAFCTSVLSGGCESVCRDLWFAVAEWFTGKCRGRRIGDDKAVSGMRFARPGGELFFTVEWRQSQSHGRRGKTEWLFVRFLTSWRDRTMLLLLSENPTRDTSSPLQMPEQFAWLELGFGFAVWLFFHLVFGADLFSHLGGFVGLSGMGWRIAVETIDFDAGSSFRGSISAIIASFRGWASRVFGGCTEG